MSTTTCRISVLPFVNKVKAGQTGPPGDRSRRNHAAISSCHPDNFDPSTVTEETMRDIGALNKEMMAAGSRKPRRSRCGRSPKASAHHGRTVSGS